MKSFILLPDVVSSDKSQSCWSSGLQDLCRMIVGLSYMGDVRMGIAEDSSKVNRIAVGSADGLKDIYLPRLEVMFHLEAHPSSPEVFGCAWAWV